MNQLPNLKTGKVWLVLVLLSLGEWIPFLIYDFACSNGEVLEMPQHASAEPTKTASVSEDDDVSFYDRVHECVPCQTQEEGELSKYVPKLIIPGTQKSGTTFILHILGNHPDVTFFRTEPHVLDNSTTVKRGSVHQCEVWAQYKRVLAECDYCEQKEFFVDKTVEYLFRSHIIPARLACVFPKPIKLLVLLRNPTERAFSDYQMYVRLKRQGYSGAPGDFFDFIRYEKDTLDSVGVFPGLDKKEGFLAWKRSFILRQKRQHNARKTMTTSLSSRYMLLDSLSPTFLSRGLYAPVLTHWIDVLSDMWKISREELVKDYFLILDNDDIKANMEATTTQILGFAGLPPYQYDMNQFQQSSRIHNYTSMTVQEREFLDDFYRPFNVELYNLLQPHGIEIGFAKQAAEGKTMLSTK